MSRRRFATVAMAFSLVAAAFNGCGKDDAPPAKPGASADPPANTRKAPPVTAKVVKVDPRAFLDEFKADDIATLAKYDNVVIEMTAVIDSASAVRPRWPMLTLRVEGKPGQADRFDLLGCFTSDPKPWQKVGPGGMVTIRAFLKNERFTPFFERCEIVSFEGDPYFQTTAEAFAKEFIADASESKRAFYKTYESEPIVMEGVVDSHTAENFGGNMTIKGADGVTFKFNYGVVEQDGWFKNVKPGDALKGVFHLYFSRSPNVIEMNINSALPANDEQTIRRDEVK